ncbi:MAG: hypothetical protein WCW62_13025, partial [Bacteroidales bacterium]
SHGTEEGRGDAAEVPGADTGGTADEGGDYESGQKAEGRKQKAVLRLKIYEKSKVAGYCYVGTSANESVIPAKAGTVSLTMKAIGAPSAFCLLPFALIFHPKNRSASSAAMHPDPAAVIA